MIRSAKGRIGWATGRTTSFARVVFVAGFHSRYFHRSAPVTAPVNPPNELKPSHKKRSDHGRFKISAGW